jgi:hypothetical protein
VILEKVRMSNASAEQRRSRLRAGSIWLLLLFICACVLTAVDTFLIARSTALFSGGFLVVAPRRSARDFTVYLLQSLELDVTLVLGIWLIVLPILRRTRLAARQTLVAAALIALAPPLWFVYVRYHLSRYLGEVMDPSLWLALAGGSPIEWFAQAESQLIPVAGALAASLVAGVLFVRSLRNGGARVRGAADVPALAAVALAFAGAAAVSASILQSECAQAGASCEALERKASGTVLVPFFQRATDFDFDGYGMFSPLADQAPFDPSRHPFALDVPGDGIDQNGLAGDHPLDYRAPPDEFVEQPVFRRKPNVLMIFLEGVRADILGTEMNGLPVTPYLEKLIADGAHSEHAYANSPYTARSRGQLMGGRLAPTKGQSTLIDDFHANGYEVAWISGQDESFGAEESETLGLGRTDFHFDAREEAEHSVARFSTTGSLMISWKRVNQRIDRFLEARKPDRPLFLFVNFGDTHYPYDHRELDDILGVPRLAVHEIRPENAPGVYKTYANATANVDRAIEQLVAMWRAKLGDDFAVVVTSDHGEALFETGVLGHGLALDATQTRVPLVVVGLGGDWPEPFGLADVRAALQHSLAQAPGDGPPRARFAPVPGRHILQYMAVVEQPHLLCLRGFDTELRYDVNQRIPPTGPDFQNLIWWWESLQLENPPPSGG